MKVYLRDANSDSGFQFTDCYTVEDVETLVESMRKVGVYSDGEVKREVTWQYIIDRHVAAIEIVVQ
jgi:hypothetical protein